MIKFRLPTFDPLALAHSLQSAVQLIPVSLRPQSSLPTFSAADWALAVCTQMEGKAGGSTIVARGMGNTRDLQAVLTAAVEYTKNRL